MINIIGAKSVNEWIENVDQTCNIHVREQRM